MGWKLSSLILQCPPRFRQFMQPTTPVGCLMEVMSFEVYAKSKMCLKRALKIAKYYENIDHDMELST